MGPNLTPGVDARREEYGRAASVSVSVVIPCRNEARFILRNYGKLGLASPSETDELDANRTP